MYLIIDIKNDELPVCVSDNIKKIAIFLNKSCASVRCCINRGNVVQKKYKVLKVLDS